MTRGMFMEHIHLESCASTQLYLSDNIDEMMGMAKSSDFLVTTNHQTDGVGRTGNKWDDLEQALAFSFSLRPNATFSITPLEVGCILVNYFRHTFKKEISLKWPNDLLTGEGKKCGGIICNYQAQNMVIVGVGINLSKPSESKDTSYYKTPVGFIDLGKEVMGRSNLRKDLPAEIFNFILKNRLSAEAVVDSWSKYCLHIKKNVQINDDNYEYAGRFVGISEGGEAIIEDLADKSIHSFVAGHLS